MKKWILLLAFGFVALGIKPAHAERDVILWLSSTTATAETNKYIDCSAGHNGCRFHGVVVNSTGTANSAIVIYNSSGTATSPVAYINGAALWGNFTYDILVSSGLTYTTVGSGNYTILYQKPTYR